MLCVGDFIKVKNGQTFPIDGVIEAGTGLINESMLTGDATSVTKAIG